MDCLKKSLENILLISIFFVFLIILSPDLHFYIHSPDQGLQIAAGKLIAEGYLPFEDIFWGYNPLVAYLSAFGEIFTNSLIGETIICCIGYSISLFLVYYLVSVHSSKFIGLFASFVGLILIGRFYKWYYWLFPLLVLLCAYFFLNSNKSDLNKLLCISGFITGIGVLFRYELGSMLFILCIIVTFFVLKTHEIRTFKEIFFKYSIFLFFFILPNILWLIILQFAGCNLIDYMQLIYDITLSNNQYWSLPIPSINYNVFFSENNGIAIVFRLVPFSLLIGLIYGFYGIKTHKKNVHKYMFLIFTSTLGLIIFPLALNRADYLHLLQVIPPVIIVVSIFLSDVRDRIGLNSKNFRNILLYCLLCMYFFTIILTGFMIAQSGHIGGPDFSPLTIDPIPKLLQISEGINAYEKDDQLSIIIQKIKENTNRSDKILIIPPVHQLYYFIDRPMSGMTLWYGPGMYDMPKWRSKNLERILQNPPKFVLIRNDLTDGITPYRFDEYQPELYSYIISYYNSTVTQTKDYSILKRGTDKIPISPLV